MADELRVTTQISFSKAGASVAKTVRTDVDVTGDLYESKVLNIGTSNEAVGKGDMSTVGFTLLKNLDSTNFILAGDDGTNYPVKVLAGESALFRLNGATLNLKADTAACDVEITMIED
jgi:hypothetical protein